MSANQVVNQCCELFGCVAACNYQFAALSHGTQKRLKGAPCRKGGDGGSGLESGMAGTEAFVDRQPLGSGRLWGRISEHLRGPLLCVGNI